MKVTIFCSILLVLMGCGTTSNYGKRPDFSEISIGMSQQEVIEKLGKPEDMAAQAGTVYLNYVYTPWYDHNGADGSAEQYYVRLINNKVESYGRKGDFDSTKNPEQTINVNVKSR